jgi:TRAP-type mannitol/chloroaromatic compound transport system substrate-binding protein
LRDGSTIIKQSTAIMVGVSPRFGAQVEENMAMQRRRFLAVTGAIVGATTLAAPAIAQGVREWKMVTSWPKNLPGLGTSAERLARAVTAITNGRIQIKVFGDGELVSAFEAFDAVSSGLAEMYHSAEYYWEKHSPAFNFFAAAPFGFTADEMASWIQWGGGQELWDELSAGFGIKPLMATNTGCQMGGWFTKEVSGPQSYNGLRYRMPGMGGEVLRRLGAVVVNLPGGAISAALKSGAIDASEWVGPWNDMTLGLHKASKYYYYPGFHEPGTVLSAGINKKIWDELSGEERNAIATAAGAEYSYSLAEFNFNNAKSLDLLVQDKTIEIRKFDEPLLQALGKASGEVLADAGRKDALTRKIHDSYMGFWGRANRWAELSERGYLNARGLKFPYGDKA